MEKASSRIRSFEVRCCHPLLFQGGPGRAALRSRILLSRRDRQFVAPLVLRMTAVTADDCEPNSVFSQELVELLPAVFVLERLELLAFAAPPAVSLPAGQPLAAAARHILAVGDDFDLRGLLERFETGD